MCKILKKSTWEGIQSQMKDDKAEIENLKEQVTAAKNAKSDYDRQIKDANDEIENLKAENERLRRKNTEFEGELKNTKSELKSAHAEKVRLQQELDSRKPTRTANGRFASKKGKKGNEE